MVPDIHAKFHNQSFIMHRAIWRHVFGETHSLTHKLFFNLIGSPPKFDTLLASWYPTYMQSFIISHSSCTEQYGDMSLERHSLTHERFLNLIGSPPKFDTLLASWYPTYMQSFIISHSSCAEQLWRQVFGETCSHTQTGFLKNIIGSLGHHQNLTYCWHHGTRHTCKVS